MKQRHERATGALVCRIRHPLTLVWDRLPADRSGIVWDYRDDQKGRLPVEYLPPYAPELNPVEYICAHPKQQELPNVGPKDFWQLSEAAVPVLPFTNTGEIG